MKIDNDRKQEFELELCNDCDTLEKRIAKWDEEEIKIGERTWLKISQLQFLTPEFIDKYWKNLYIHLVSLNNTLSNEHIERILSNSNTTITTFENVIRHQKLDESIINKYGHKFLDSHWKDLYMYRELPESCIDKFHYKIDWHVICKTQKLSEEFIAGRMKLLDMKAISRYQILSMDFIHRYADKVYWPYILEYQDIDIQFIRNHMKYIEKSYMEKFKEESDNDEFGE